MFILMPCFAAAAATFAVMLLGLSWLYVDPTAADSHLRLFDTTWYFTAPWMVLNGAFAGTRRTRSSGASPQPERAGLR